MFTVDINKLLDSMSPAERRNHDRHMAIFRIQMKIYKFIKWPSMPILNVVWVFWTCVMDEGIKNTCAPRWGALTFSYLNDGYKPTLYHTLRTIISPHKSAIYIGGAPRNGNEWKNGRTK